MEKQSYYLLLALVVIAICLGVFWMQYTHDTPTYMIINGSEVTEGGSFSGLLMDAYGQPVPNRTITFHKPGYQMGTIVDTQTDDTGKFTIDNAEYLSDNPDENYYGNFTFAGDERYHGCIYEGNVTVIPK